MDSTHPDSSGIFVELNGFRSNKHTFCYSRNDCTRLRVVSLFLGNPLGRTQKTERARDSWGESLARSGRAGRRAKRETAVVSYNDCEARHSGDGVILLVDDDAQLTATFISDMRVEFEPYLLFFCHQVLVKD